VVFDKSSLKFYRIAEADIEVRQARGKGLGVFARRSLKRGGFIEYRGRLLIKTELKHVRNRQYVTQLPSRHPASRRYFMDGNPKHTPPLSGCVGCYCNDSRKRPTSFLTYLPSKKIVVIALGRNVKRGQEITWDYGPQYNRTWV
jgi:SET domain-containing protein